MGSATLFVGLGAAGALPGAAQVVASNVLATVGVSAPNPDAPVNVDSRPAVNSDGPTGATNVNGGTDGGSAPGTGKGTTISGIASDGSTTGVDKGAVVSGVASDDQSDAGQHGSPTSPKTGSPDPAGSGNNGNGDPNGNNGNHNGADNGKSVGNGNARCRPGQQAVTLSRRGRGASLRPWRRCRRPWRGRAQARTIRSPRRWRR